MGAFLVSFHAQTDDPQAVRAALLRNRPERAWVAPSGPGWVSFWEEQASNQDGERIVQLATTISRDLQTKVAAFLIHDSDLFCYWLATNGEILDHFNSCPGYFGDMGEDDFDAPSSDSTQEHWPQDTAANLQQFQSFCKPGTSLAELEKPLSQWTDASAEPEFLFAEERLTLLAPHLGIDEDKLHLDFHDFEELLADPEVAAEITLHWAGTSPDPTIE